MGTPLDVAAGAVGFASISVLVMQGCIKGFVLLSTAQNFGHDADLVRCEIEFEQYRLFRWADKVGLESDSPNRNLNWAIINDVLNQLNALMNDTSKFKSEYGLELITTEDKLSADDLAVPKSGLRKLMARVKPEFHNQTARRLHTESSVWKRFKWAAIDKDGIDMLVNDIRRKVDKLYDLLQVDDQRFIKLGIEALLRHAVSQATKSSDLLAIEQLLQPELKPRTDSEEHAVKTALSLKQQRLMLDVGDSRKPNSGRSSSTTLVASNASSMTIPTNSISRRNSHGNQNSRGSLSWKLLVRSELSIREPSMKEIAMYDDEPVFVEWKVVERGIESKLKHRIKSLATLLQAMDSSTFHSLNCIGYLKDLSGGRYGYAFRLPRKTGTDYKSLAQVLQAGTCRPSLNDRISLAMSLAETVLQLHTSGWLHKGIRADNVLFFPANGDDVDLKQGFLGGYEYARADNPSDMTEFPAVQQELNLYRHPALLKANRASFEKSFDLFALGCVLIEIGLWADITTTLLRLVRRGKGVENMTFPVVGEESLSYAGKTEMMEVNKARMDLLTNDGKGSIKEALEFAAGTSFAQVAYFCLGAHETRTSQGDNDDDEDNEEDGEGDRCIDLELEVLQRLRSCNV